ncbi:hypothetical protein Tco_0856044 [Tanacetum coccineum]
MCCQPLPPPLSPPSAKLLIMALEECGYQSRRGIRVPKKWRSSYSGDVILKKNVIEKVLGDEMKRFKRLIWIESYELMIDLQSIRDPESINF